MSEDERLRKKVKEKGWVIIPDAHEDDGANRVHDTLFSPVTTQNKSERVSIRMSVVEKEWLEEVASNKKSSTSEIIRDALNIYKKYVEGEGHV